MQLTLDYKYAKYFPPKTQLLKWVGNKQRFAGEISKYFPADFNNFYEPFLGSGAITATIAPSFGIGSDIFSPLMEIWITLSQNPEKLVKWYSDRRNRMESENKRKVYEEVKESYNSNPNGADLLFLSRSCYGGIVRFRKNDGFMSTPCGVHDPISNEGFEKRVKEWYKRTKNVKFLNIGFEQAFEMAQANDLIYCDPPYSHSQNILYGAQQFSLSKLFKMIENAKSRGVRVALSIDGSKKSGSVDCELPIPKDLFEREVYITLGQSMLKRFQMEGKTLENEIVSDRLLLTY